jgi:hypothetical protein
MPRPDRDLYLSVESSASAAAKQPRGSPSHQSQLTEGRRVFQPGSSKQTRLDRLASAPIGPARIVKSWRDGDVPALVGLLGKAHRKKLAILGYQSQHQIVRATEVGG